MAADTKQWVSIYLPYIDSARTVAQGRRVSKAIAVENPALPEISEVLQFLKLHHSIENKAYPRDILSRGRIKVQLKLDGNLMNPEISTKKQLLVKLCEFIPRLKSRLNKEEAKETSTSNKKNKKKKKK
ncbi:unnamed protein product [Blepharisma stoltei]|uniref:Signal recognition particle 19 kDa protein n=1 Tax=Blepharisma stoltei TaxID=1481888 RepID=A0AAU9K4A0_9CILI|nr:unnamed protein product [Blepharisma stoltei]